MSIRKQGEFLILATDEDGAQKVMRRCIHDYTVMWEKRGLPIEDQGEGAILTDEDIRKLYAWTNGIGP